MIIFVSLFMICFLEANPISPGLNSWFSASKISYAGGGDLIFTPNSRSANPASHSLQRNFSTSFIFFPAGIQSQSASITLPKKSILLTTAINHLSYGTFIGYDEEAMPTKNFNSTETWLRLDYSNSLIKYPIRYGISNQFYFSNLEEHSFTKLYFTLGAIWGLEKYKINIGLSIDDFVINISPKGKERYDPPQKYNVGLSKQLKHLPLKISIDYLSIAANNEDFFISGIFYISQKLSISCGTSTRKLSQNTNEDVLKTILGSTGLGISFVNDNITIGYGLYFYGTGGSVNGIDLSIKF